jgi:hypothetical protein
VVFVRSGHDGRVPAGQHACRVKNLGRVLIPCRSGNPTSLICVQCTTTPRVSAYPPPLHPPLCPSQSLSVYPPLLPLSALHVLPIGMQQHL